MKIIKFLVSLVLVLAAVYLVLCFVAPKKFNMQVSKTISTNPNIVFMQIADFKNWSNWSIWNNLDPNWKTSYSGPSNAVGTTHSWQSSHSQVGNGSQTILASDSINKNFKTKLDFGAAGTSISNINVVANGAGSKVTWDMYDDKEMPFYIRGFSLVMTIIMKGVFTDNINNLETYCNGKKVVFEK